jgi:hypothetical protein
VRLEYAKESEGFGFHVDVVPARLGQEDAPLDVPMRGYEDWRGTAPLEYTQWCLDQGEPFRRTVRELKRWCDVHDSSIKSIALQVLIGYCMPENAETDARRIVLTLENIMARLNAHPDTPPMIENPVLVAENLASRWERVDYQRFLRELGEAITLAKQALRSDDEEESHELWQELLGSDFPDALDGSKGLTVPPPPPPQRKPKPERGRRYG